MSEPTKEKPLDLESLRAKVRERLALIESKREPEPAGHPESTDYEDWAQNDFISECLIELCNWFLSLLEPTEPK